MFTPIRKPIEALPATDKDGKAEISVTLPGMPRTGQPLEADVILKLRESGGRTIERTVTLPVDMRQPRLGIKPGFTNNQAAEDDLAAFDTILLDTQAKPIAAKGLKWELLRLDNRWQWYSRDGSWNYEAITSTRRIAGGTVDTTAAEPGKISARLGWGRYRLEVSSPDGVASSYVFNAGYYADETADSPEVLDVALDKASYKAGDTARVKITSRMGGRALLAVLNTGLAHMQEAELPEGGGEIAVRVSEDWNPGAYITVALYRPMDEKAKRMPSRAMGLRWLAIDQSERTLAVSASLPEKVKSNTEVMVPVKVAGLSAGESAHITVAAIDVGILNLTSFQTPKPQDWFYGQRRMGTEVRDLYGRLIDGMRAERGRLRSGGDGTASGMTMQGNPPVEATIALFSGIVKLGADGTAQVPFQMPDFNGTVRFTIVAWSDSKVGSAHKDVIVRDTMAVTAAAPRFLTLGDKARLELALHNVEGGTGTYSITGTFEQDGTGTSKPAFERQVQIGQGERKREAFELAPTDVGPMQIAVRVTGPGVEINRRLTFDVKVPAGDIKRLSVSALAKENGRLVVSNDLFQDLIPQKSRVMITAGPSAGFDVPGLLASLDRYPYGCAEQTTSRALPLVYLNEVAKLAGLKQDDAVRERVQKAIDRLWEMQESSGAFGVWGPRDGDVWLTAYVTDFLTRAKEAGYAVAQRPFSLALDKLANTVSGASDFEKGGQDIAYALYVLARNGRAPVGELRYFVDSRLERFATTPETVGRFESLATLHAAVRILAHGVREERSLVVHTTLAAGEQETIATVFESDPSVPAHEAVVRIERSLGAAFRDVDFSLEGRELERAVLRGLADATRVRVLMRSRTAD